MAAESVKRSIACVSLLVRQNDKKQTKTNHMPSSQVLQHYQHEVLQLLPQAVQLEILACGHSLGSLLAVVLRLLLKLGWAAGWVPPPLHHIQLLHNLTKSTQNKVTESSVTSPGLI